MAKKTSAMIANPLSATIIPFRRRVPVASSEPTMTAAGVELVRFYKDMAVKAAKGEITGLMFVTLNADGEDEWGMCGAFTADMDRALRAASGGLVEFLAYKAEVEC